MMSNTLGVVGFAILHENHLLGNPWGKKSCISDTISWDEIAWYCITWICHGWCWYLAFIMCSSEQPSANSYPLPGIQADWTIAPRWTMTFNVSCAEFSRRGNSEAPWYVLMVAGYAWTLVCLNMGSPRINWKWVLDCQIAVICVF